MRWIMGTTRQKCHSHERVMSADRTVLDSYRAKKSDVINDTELKVELLVIKMCCLYLLYYDFTF